MAQYFGVTLTAPLSPCMLWEFSLLREAHGLQGQSVEERV
jgi:hypothetical protein